MWGPIKGWCLHVHYPFPLCLFLATTQKQNNGRLINRDLDSWPVKWHLGAFEVTSKVETLYSTRATGCEIKGLGWVCMDYGHKRFFPPWLIDPVSPWMYWKYHAHDWLYIYWLLTYLCEEALLFVMGYNCYPSSYLLWRSNLSLIVTHGSKYLLFHWPRA